MEQQVESNIDQWLDRQYNPSYWSKKHPNREAVLKHFFDHCVNASEVTRKSLTCDLNVAYGTSAREAVDYFYPNNVKENCAKILIIVFIHGGCWCEGSKEMHSFLAQPFVQRGHIVAIVGYDLAPNVNLNQIIDQVQSGIESVEKRFSGANLVLIGHSAGAHLAATVASKVKPAGLVLLSGVYDLMPLIKTSVNIPLKLSEDSARQLSVDKDSFLCGDNTRKVIVMVGDQDSPEFQKQSKMFFDIVKEKGIPAELIIAENEDHFSLVENMINDESVVLKAVLDMMRNLNS